MEVSDEPDEKAVGVEDERAPVYRGSVTTRSVLRATSGEFDADLYEYVDLEVGRPEDRFTARVSGRVAWDVDGDSGDVFDGLNDTGSSSLDGKLYDAYVEVHGIEELELVRAGRQSDWETPEFLVYDGLRAESAVGGDLDLRVGLFGGQSVHHYESSPSGDFLVGAYAELRPWEDGRARLDWVYAEDDRSGGTFDRSLFGLALWQRLSELRLVGRASALDDELRDVDLRATWYEPESHSVVRASYYELFETQAANPLEFDTFQDTLFDYFPFRRASLSAGTLTSYGYFEGGVDVRALDDSDDEQEFNRDVARYFLTTSWTDVLSDEDTLSLTGELWSSTAQETEAVGASYARPLREGTELAISTYYSAYTFDSLNVLEKQDVQTYAVALRNRVSERIRVDVGYDYEDTDVEDFHTVRIQLRWRL